MLSSLLDFLAPNRCAVCRAEVERSALAAPYFCDFCSPRGDPLDTDLETLGEPLGLARCPACHELSAASDGLCPLCTVYPLGVRALVSAFPYDTGFESAMRMLKYGGAHRLIGYFSELMIAWLADQQGRGAPALQRIFNGEAALLPLPSHANRVVARGYHHTALIARAIGRAFGIPVYPRALRVSSLRPAQASLPAHCRAANIEGAIAVGTRPRATSLVLFDDMVTSGSTIREATSALRSDGPCDILALTITRSRRFQAHRARAACGSGSGLLKEQC